MIAITEYLENKNNENIQIKTHEICLKLYLRGT